MSMDLIAAAEERWNAVRAGRQTALLALIVLAIAAAVLS